MSCLFLPCVLLCNTERILKFTFPTGILSCHGSGISQFSQAQVYVFVLTAFVYISYLTHFAMTSLVIFAKVCTLLCYEIFVLKFR